MNNTVNELKSMFKQGDLLTKLIFINTGVFIVAALVSMVCYLFKLDTGLLYYLMMPAGLNTLALRAWTPITYMFLHQSFIHFICNMIMLHFAGRMFLHTFQQRDLVNVYIFGGLAGAALFVAGYHTFPALTEHAHNAYIEGASASITAILVSIAVATPEMPVKLPLVGEYKLKWIAAIFVGLSILIDFSSNAGGCISHIGGALGGYLFARNYAKGTNIAAWIGTVIDELTNLFSRLGSKQKSPKFKVVYNSKEQGRKQSDAEYNMQRKAENEDIDAILDKIKASGYDSLSKEEKDRLFNASKK